MTTSGSSNWTQTRDQIIKRALRQCQVIASGETPTADAMADAVTAMNALIKQWNATGIHLWTETEAILFLVAGQNKYMLGPDSTEHVSQDYAQVSLSATALAAATSITVTDASDILASDHIGIVLDDGTIFWTTVNGAPSGSTVHLAGGLTSAASSGNDVFVYTTTLLRPLRIVDARRYHLASKIDTSMIALSRLDYRQMPNKDAQGTVTQYFYDPQIGNGYIYLWPSPSDSTFAVKFTWYRSLQDMDASANTADFPQEWINALTWNLAKEIMIEYGVPAQTQMAIAGMAAETLDIVKQWDKEPESMFFGPAFVPGAR